VLQIPYEDQDIETRHGEAQAVSGCEFVEVSTLKTNQQADAQVALGIC